MGHYLVTGGCGFIGSHLVEALCGRGHQVRILDDLSTGTLAHKPPQAEFVRGDVADGATVRDALRGMDGCFHLAAIASVELSNRDWVRAHRINVGGTVAVFEAAARARLDDTGSTPAGATAGGSTVPVVLASSAAVYGDNPDLPLSEMARPRPLSAYAVDKLGSELHGMIARHIHLVPNLALRFFNVYGPRQDPASPYSGVISVFCDRLRSGRAITLHGDGRQTRDFIYVADVVEALIAAMETCAAPGGVAPGEAAAGDVLNVCTGTATSVRELAMILGRIVGQEPQIGFAPARQGDVRFSVGDPAKARRVLGFSASTPLAEGLAQALRSR